MSQIPLLPGEKLKVKQTRQSQRHPWSASALCVLGVGRILGSSWSEAEGEDVGGTEGGEGEKKRKEENISERGEQSRKRAEF